MEFSKWWVTEFKHIKFPSQGTIFDYFLDHETKRWSPWSEKLQKFFYGDFVGIQGAIGGFDILEQNALLEGDLEDTTGLYTSDRHHGLKLIYRSSQVHNSLITLTFTADSVTFVQNRYP